jgi:HK97 family phage portal protein
MGFFNYLDSLLKTKRAQAMGTPPPPPPTPVTSIGTAEAALRISTVYACVRILAETIACMPRWVYDSAGKAVDHPVEALINFAPNEYMDSVNFWVYTINAMLLRGNGLAVIERSAGGQARLIPVEPSKFEGIRLATDTAGRYSKIYKIDGAEIADAAVLHFTGPALDASGLMGLSVIERYALSTVNHAQQIESYSTEAFKKGTNVSGVAEFPNLLSPEDRNAFRAELDALHGGMAAGGRLAILDGGASLKPITLTPDDTKFIASRNFSIEEVCRWFGVPLFLVQNGQQQSYNSNESSSTAFSTYTLLPLARRLEQQINRKLFPARDYRVEFDFGHLLRPSTKDLYDAEIKAAGGPIKTANEAREAIGLPPVAGGDTLAKPLNMGPATPAQEAPNAEN